jgi:protease I
VTIAPEPKKREVEMAKLTNRRVAVLITDGVEEAELTETLKALRREEAEIVVASPRGEEVQVMRHDEKTMKAASQASTGELSPHDFDAVLLPGGTMNADRLRMDEPSRRFVGSMDSDGKAIAAICHAPWLLISAGLVSGRRLTSYYTLQDDIRNAGGNWVDEETVVDRNWLTSRQPGDIPAFNSRMIEMFAEARQPVR